MRLACLALLPLLLGGCGAAIQIAVQAATEMAVRTTHYAIVAGSRESAMRNYADVGFTADRPDAIRPPEEAATWLRANRDAFKDQVSAYNKAHDLARGPGDSGGERVTDVFAVDWILLSDARLDKLSAVTEYRVGARDFVTANETFVLQWQGDTLAIVDHLDSAGTTLAAYLGLPPSPADPVAAAKAGNSSPDAITAAPAPAGTGTPPVLATQPATTASAGTTTSGAPAAPAADPAAAQAEFDAWLGSNRADFIAGLQRQLTALDHRNHTNCAQAVTKVYNTRVLARQGNLYTVALTYDTRCTVGWQGSYSFQDTFGITLVADRLERIALASAPAAATTDSTSGEPGVQAAQAAATQAEFEAWLEGNRTEFIRELGRLGREQNFPGLESGYYKINGLKVNAVERDASGAYLIVLTYTTTGTQSFSPNPTSGTVRVRVSLDGDRLVSLEASQAL